jgi:sec-independent protein translocase protein TatC
MIANHLRGMKEMPRMKLTEHLGELKHRLKIIVIAYAVNLVFWLMVPVDITDVNGLMSGMYQPFVSYVMDNAHGLAAGRITIISGSLTSPLEIYFYASAILAFLTASPAIAYEVYKFVDPALLPNERSIVYKFLAAFVGLMAGGALMGYFILTPATVRFMSYFGVVVNAQPIITASDYYGMVFLIVGATALAFTTPAFFVLLIRFGIVSTSTLTKNRLLVYGVLYIAIVILTPEPLVAHVGMFLPIVGLMELSVIVGRRVERNRLKANESRETLVPTSTGMPSPFGQACSYCGAQVAVGSRFCPTCSRAQA